MRILIRGGQVYQADGHGFAPKDILIEGDRIGAVADNLTAPGEDAQVIEARGRLVIPGLVNCHIHSHDNFNRGCADNLPLEMWMANIRPFFSGLHHTPRMVYLRTLLGAAEMLKSGVTAVMDDVILAGPTDPESLAMVVKAYRDAGMRAVVCPHTKNIPLEKTIPLAESRFTPEMRATTNGKIPGERELLRFLEAQLLLYNQSGDGRVRLGLSASGPQRCTLGLMMGMKGLAQSYGVPVVSHVLETYVQKRTGELFFGKSLVRYLEDNGLLYPNFVAIHCNWADEFDIGALAAHGCKAVHNPCCNLKMGSGVAPVRELLRELRVGLGTDNISANDTANVFEAMKVGALLSKIRTPDYAQWLDETDMLRMATQNGAACLQQEDSIGRIEPGFKADLALVDTNNERLITAWDYAKALVYAENGKSVETVLVEGRVVVRDGRMTQLDEGALFEELASLRPTLARERALSLKEYGPVRAVFEDVYRRLNDPRWPKAKEARKNV